MWRFSMRHNISFKTLHAAEQQRAVVARARRRWMRAQRMFDPSHLVFLDETPQYEMMRVGAVSCARCRPVPHGHCTIPSSLFRCRMTAPYVLTGYVEEFLYYV